jgi:hypothetical protein
MKKVITVLLCCITTLGYTQSKSDSLLELWKNVENSDSTRLKSLRSYLVGLKKIDMDSALNYAMLGLEYASSSKNEKERFCRINLIQNEFSSFLGDSSC